MNANTKLYLTRKDLDRLEEVYEKTLDFDDISSVLEGLHYGPDDVRGARNLANYGMERKDPEYIPYSRWLKMVKQAIDEGYVSTFEYQNADIR